MSTFIWLQRVDGVWLHRNEEHLALKGSELATAPAAGGPCTSQLPASSAQRSQKSSAEERAGPGQGSGLWR